MKASKVIRYNSLWLK